MKTSRWIGNRPYLMNKNILEEDVLSLTNARMKYPTWEVFKDLINYESPVCYFGNIPMRTSVNPLVPVTATSELQGMINGHNHVGIDVPVLLEPKNSCPKKTIVIVGESPLRDIKISSNQNKLLLGTPYAVHQEFGSPSQCNVYKKIFSDLLKNGYSIYLTDIIKVWWDGKKLKANLTDEQLFQKEMESLEKHDKVFVAWGKRAKDNLGKWTNGSIIDLPHPSRQNWNNWKLHIFKRAIYDKQDISYAKKLYPQKDSTTTEVVVAQEAVTEILDRINKP